MSEVQRVFRKLAIHPDVKRVEVTGATITYWHHSGSYRFFCFTPDHGEREFWAFFRRTVHRRRVTDMTWIELLAGRHTPDT